MITTIDMFYSVYDGFCMANASTTLQVRLPVKLRDEAAVMLEEMGLDLPTAIRLYLTKVVRTRRIPFELDANPAVKTVETVEAIEVDEALQGRMDRIGTAWKKAGKKR
jgi:DNA-damage-inducible protein J